MSFGLGTVLHCAESTLYHEFEYFKRLFGPVTEIPCRLEDGSTLVLRHRFRLARYFPNKIRAFFEPAMITESQVSLVRFQAAPIPYVVNRAVQLGRDRRVNYYWPSPTKALWRKPDLQPATPALW